MSDTPLRNHMPFRVLDLNSQPGICKLELDSRAAARINNSFMASLCKEPASWSVLSSLLQILLTYNKTQLMTFPHTLHVLWKSDARLTNFHTENFHLLCVQEKERAATKLLKSFTEKSLGRSRGDIRVNCAQLLYTLYLFFQLLYTLHLFTQLCRECPRPTSDLPV